MEQLYETTDTQTWQDQGVSETFPRQSAATRNFQLGAPRSFHISEAADHVLFLRSEHGRDAINSLWSYDVAARIERKVADPRLLLADDGDIPAAERARRERMRETTSGITSYSTDSTGHMIAFALSGQLFSGDIKSGEFKLREVTGPVIDPKVSPNGEYISWSNGKDLFLCNFTGANEVNLTSETTDDTSWGLADFIAAEEFGRMHGFWWAPDSSALIVEQTNDSQVQSWWISDPATPSKQPQEVHYPAAGTTNATIGLVKITVTGQKQPIIWDNNAFEYLISVIWQKDCDALITVADRSQQNFVTYALTEAGLKNL